MACTVLKTLRKESVTGFHHRNLRAAAEVRVSKPSSVLNGTLFSVV